MRLDQVTRTYLGFPLLISAFHVFSNVASAAVISSDETYFAAVAQELKSSHIGQPALFIDLDRLDHNIKVLKAHLKLPLQFRVVEKSLPSLSLLKYIIEQTDSHRVMAFHHPFLKTLLTELPLDTDILFGKPIPIEAIDQIYSDLSNSSRQQMSLRVQWLIDSPQRLDEYIDFFSKKHLPFRANIEIDVGLHRGGVTQLTELNRILDSIRAHSDIVHFSGFMGYDGHVSHVPVFPNIRWLKHKAMMSTLKKVQNNYRAFYDFARSKFPILFQGKETWNGGGSSTYQLYSADSLIQDIAVGSALLMPRDLEGISLENHVPALYIATPVLKKIKNATLPFIGGIIDFISEVFHRNVWGYYIYGGGWSDQIVYPAGIEAHPLTSSTPLRNLISNQAFVYGVTPKPLELGDFVFYRPDQSDTFFLFEDIYLIRNSKIVGTWHPFSRRY